MHRFYTLGRSSYFIDSPDHELMSILFAEINSRLTRPNTIFPWLQLPCPARGALRRHSAELENTACLATDFRAWRFCLLEPLEYSWHHPRVLKNIMRVVGPLWFYRFHRWSHIFGSHNERKLAKIEICFLLWLCPTGRFALAKALHWWWSGVMGNGTTQVVWRR